MAGMKNDNRFIMLPTVDICFKALMSNPKVRKGFIAAVLGVAPGEIRETKLLPTILRQDYPDDKLGVLDVRVLMEDGTQIDIEMQVTYFEYWDARVLFYLSRMFTGQLKKGEPYDRLKKCIHVSVLDFNYFRDDEKCFRTIGFCDEETGEKYTDLMEIKILELRKLPEGVKEDSDILNWMRFLGGKGRREFEDMAKKDEYIGEAYMELERLSADEKAKLEYEAREKAIRDYNSQMGSALRRGMEQGLKQGREEGKTEGINYLISQMLGRGAAPEDIAGLTGIGLEEIEKVRKGLERK